MRALRRWMLLVCLAAACSSEPPPGADAAPDNLVVIVVDTLRADGGGAEMPAVQALARDGVAFEAAFAHAPITLPSHTAIFSSRHPFLTGVTNNAQPVPHQVPVLAEWLAQNGYRTAAAVSLASLWPIGAGRGVDRGFDAWDPGPHLLTPGDERNGDLDARLDALAAGEGPFFLFAHYADPHEPYNPHDADGAARPLRVTLDGQPVAEASLTAMRTVEAELLAEPGEHVLELAAGEDFRLRHLRLEDSRGELALVLEEGALGEAAPRVRARFTVTPGDGPVQLTAWVHDVPPEEAIPARYAAEVAFADAAVGRLLDGLRERGLYETSTIVFTSDHGEALGEHGCFGHIVNLYDEMLHVPLVIKPARGHPATRRLRARSGDLVGHVDLAPTVLDLLGLPRFDGVAGTSLLARADHPLLAETRRPEAPRDLLALRDLRYKLVYDVDLDSFELYDLSTDPGELVNVYEQRIHERSSWPARLRELAATPPGVAAPGISPDTEIRARLRALGYTGQ